MRDAREEFDRFRNYWGIVNRLQEPSVGSSTTLINLPAVLAVSGRVLKRTILHVMRTILWWRALALAPAAVAVLIPNIDFY